MLSFNGLKNIILTADDESLLQKVFKQAKFELFRLQYLKIQIPTA